MAKKRQIKKENMRLREQAEKNNKIIADLKNQLKMKESEKTKGPAAPGEDFTKNVLEKLSYLESTISRIQKDVIESDPKDLHAKEEYVKLIDQVKKLFKSFVNDIKSSFTNKVDGVKNEINSLITNKVQSINDKFKALSDSIDAKFPDPTGDAVEKQEPAKEAEQAVEKQDLSDIVPKVAELIAENNTLKSENNGLKSENAALKTFVSALRKFYPDQVNDTQIKINKMFEGQHAKSKDQDIQKPTQKVTTIKSESISL
ncbi:hypothetical protein [Bacillus stratosphericus]|uniref:hypothetical protein n=1 Tax=Bacillus stratosphericus TaxID=293386 RepID=UPI001CF99436|nr:hypothetical protein [Bacillus stratosphericus]